jgi:hypothetical protein
MLTLVFFRLVLQPVCYASAALGQGGKKHEDGTEESVSSFCQFLNPYLEFEKTASNGKKFIGNC